MIPPLVLVFSATFGGPPRVNDPDPWFGRDKAAHFAVSALIQSGTHAALRSRGVDYGRASWSAAGVTAAVGVGKEWWDLTHHRDFSVRDLTWDGIGGATAAVIVRQVDR